MKADEFADCPDSREIERVPPGLQRRVFYWVRKVLIEKFKKKSVSALL